jgi:hypothetical protein
MSIQLSSLLLAAEPASLLYIVTGATGFAIAGLRKSRRSAKPSSTAVSTAMLFCQRDSRKIVRDLGLL